MTNSLVKHDRGVIALRLFDALRLQYPEKYIALILPPKAADESLPASDLVTAKVIVHER